MNPAVSLIKIRGLTDVGGNEAVVVERLGDAIHLDGERDGNAFAIEAAGEGDDGGGSPTVAEEKNVGAAFLVGGKPAVVIEVEMLANHGVSFALAAILVHAEENVAGILLAQALQELDFGVMVSIPADEAAHKADDEGFGGRRRNGRRWPFVAAAFAAWAK